MAVLHRTALALRVSSEDLDPEQISHALGCAPTYQQRKGETRTSPTSGHTRVAKHGIWMLEAKDQEPGDLDGQVAEILSKLSQSLDVWRSIGEEHELDFYCGLFMRQTNEGLAVSAKTLAALSERGITLGLDIYSPTSEDLAEERRNV